MSWIYVKYSYPAFSRMLKAPSMLKIKAQCSKLIHSVLKSRKSVKLNSEQQSSFAHHGECSIVLSSPAWRWGSSGDHLLRLAVSFGGYNRTTGRYLFPFPVPQRAESCHFESLWSVWSLWLWGARWPFWLWVAKIKHTVSDPVLLSTQKWIR